MQQDVRKLYSREDGGSRFTKWETTYREELTDLSSVCKTDKDNENDVVNTGYDNMLEIVPCGKYSDRGCILE
jgi:hypothetical protein